MNIIIVARAKDTQIKSQRQLALTTNFLLTLALLLILFSFPVLADDRFDDVPLLPSGAYMASPDMSSIDGWHIEQSNENIQIYTYTGNDFISGLPFSYLRMDSPLNGYYESSVDCNFDLSGVKKIMFSLQSTQSQVDFYIDDNFIGSYQSNLAESPHYEYNFTVNITDLGLTGSHNLKFSANSSIHWYVCLFRYLRFVGEESENPVIWYNGTDGVKINWNYEQWVKDNYNYGIPIKAYIWENSSTGSFYHSDDMLSFGSSLPYGNVNAVYPSLPSTSSLYIVFLKNNEYVTQYIGSAHWNGGGSAAVNDTNYTLPTPPEVPPIAFPDWLNGTAPPTNFSLPDLLRPSGNFSAVNTYLDFIDSVFDPIREFTFAVANFFLYPISIITEYINKATEQFNQIANSIVNAGFLAEVVRPCLMAIPVKISMLITFSLLLYIIEYLLRYR